ncbi:MAG: CsiV family protein [Marinagarivorans sp.]
MSHTIRRFCVLVIGLGMSAIAWAQSLYQVEVIVFERKGLVRTLGASQTSDGHNLAYLENAQVLKTQEPTDAQSAPAFTLLADSELTLKPQATSLERSKQMRVLAHQAWLQPIGRQPIGVALEGGAQFGPWHELAGTLQLSLDKSLQLNSALWYAQFMPDNGHPITNPINIPLPPDQGILSDAKSEGFFATLAVPFAFKQSIKPGVTTYVDHPIFGLIIKVQPL